MSLEVTPKSATADSYVSVADADSYLTTNRLYTTEWDDAVIGTREAALRWATTLLDLHMVWAGAPTTTTQRLRFPRAGLVDQDGNNIDQDTIPELLKQATAELALALLQRNRTEEPGLLGKGIKRVSVDVISVTVDSQARLELIPSAVLSMLAQLGQLNSDSQQTGMRQVRLVRV